MRATLRTRRGLALAVLVATALHGLLFVWLAGRDTRRTERAPRATHVTERVQALPMIDMATVALLEEREPAAIDTEVPPGRVLTALPGDHDRAATGDTPRFAHMDRDLPGRERASLGGGAAGGKDSFTGRQDRENFQTQLWNDPDKTRLSRHALDDPARVPSAPESLVRREERGFDERTDTRRRAREGAERAVPGVERGTEPGGPGAPIEERDWRAADPMFDGPSGGATPERVRGRSGARGRALSDVGARATEAAMRDVRVRDDVDTGRRSDELDPAPIEMSAPRAGGEREGVTGRRADGLSRRGRGTSGSGASRARADGEDEAAVRASRRIAYFGRMYRRMNQHITFPEDLALSLRQGEVVVRFELSGDGRVSDLTLVKSSGYTAFDRQVMAAVRELSPFGRVPSALMGERSALTVVVPYEFKNPLIR